MDGPVQVGKFFLVTVNLSSEAFLGAGFVYAVTLVRGVDVALQLLSLARVEVAPTDRRSEGAVREAGRQALEKLRARVGADFQVLGVLAQDERLHPLTFDRFPATLIIPEDSLPPDFRQAREAALTHAAAAQTLLRSELPQVPWDSSQVEDHLATLRRFGPLGIYDTSHPQLAPTWHELTRRKKMLLHVCCGPDAAGVIEQLKRDFDLVAFWYDPNIQPREEHDKRLAAFLRVAELEDVPAIVGEYDAENFLQSIRGLEHTPEQGAKCSVCYDLRLERAAIEAQRQGCDLYTTTLAISPHKVQEKLRNFGAVNEKRHGIPYYARNFMKDDGFKDSVAYTREHDIFRQNYCGCWFSLFEGGRTARAFAAQLGLDAETLRRQASAGGQGIASPPLDTPLPTGFDDPSEGDPLIKG
jgi:predicted adenine nucleotide alpha hydrolase (AANH) superfamily ATPase